MNWRLGCFGYPCRSDSASFATHSGCCTCTPGSRKHASWFSSPFHISFSSRRDQCRATNSSAVTVRVSFSKRLYSCHTPPQSWLHVWFRVTVGILPGSNIGDRGGQEYLLRRMDYWHRHFFSKHKSHLLLVMPHRQCWLHGTYLQTDKLIFILLCQCYILPNDPDNYPKNGIHTHT